MERIVMKILFLLLAAMMVGDFSPAAAQAPTEAQDAYDKVLQEIKTLEHGLGARTSMKRMVDVFGKIEKRLRDFISSYPESEQATDARFQLGVLYANVQDPQKAAAELSRYVGEAKGAPAEKLALAHYYLAESYKATDQFDEAKEHYRLVVDRYPGAGKRLVAMAKMSLEDLDFLRRLAVGSDPIPFSVEDLNGKTISLGDYKGKVVLLDFWATWCGPCRQEMPNVVKLYNKYHSKGFEIIGISLDANRKTLERYLREQGVTWPQYYDGRGWKNKVASLYRVRAIPATYLIDKKGKIRYRSVRGHRLAQAVDKLIRE